MFSLNKKIGVESLDKNEVENITVEDKTIANVEVETDKPDVESSLMLPPPLINSNKDSNSSYISGAFSMAKSFLSPLSAYTNPSVRTQYPQYPSQSQNKSPVQIKLSKGQQVDSDDDSENLSSSQSEEELDLDDPIINSFPALNSSQRQSNNRLQPSSAALPGRRKVPLGKGYSALDWARFSKEHRNQKKLERYTLEDLKTKKSREECWMSIQGKVYDCTNYMKFHPGGDRQLMRGAGKDATELFMKVHSWVNVDRMLEHCHVGYLVG
ncbi:hypothetical protein HDU92_004043 [Lobulomyces angularis]|nr:hypothetical protein HDU92_004043 [Lobulomyces angularis]